MKKIFKDKLRNEIVDDINKNKKFILCSLDKNGDIGYIYNKKNIPSLEIIGILETCKSSIIQDMRERYKEKLNEKVYD